LLSLKGGKIKKQNPLTAKVTKNLRKEPEGYISV